MTVRIKQSPLSIVVSEVGSKRAFMIPVDTIDAVTTDEITVIRRKKNKSKRYNVESITIHTDKGPVVFDGECITELKGFIDEEIFKREQEKDSASIISSPTTSTHCPHITPDKHNEHYYDGQDTLEKKDKEMEKEEELIIVNKIEEEEKIPKKNLVSSTVLSCPASAIISAVMRGDALLNALRQMGCSIKNERRENGMLFLTHTVPTGIPLPKYITCSQTISSELSPNCCISSHVSGTGHKWAAWMDAEWKIMARSKNNETTLYLYYYCISKAGKSVKFISNLVQDFVVEACDRTATNLRRVSERLDLTLYNFGKENIKELPLKDHNSETLQTPNELKSITNEKATETVLREIKQHEKNKKSQTDNLELNNKLHNSIDTQIITKIFILMSLVIIILGFKLFACRHSNESKLKLAQCAEEEWI